MCALSVVELGRLDTFHQSPCFSPTHTNANRPFSVLARWSFMHGSMSHPASARCVSCALSSLSTPNRADGKHVSVWMLLSNSSLYKSSAAFSRLQSTNTCYLLPTEGATTPASLKVWLQDRPIPPPTPVLHHLHGWSMRTTWSRAFVCLRCSLTARAKKWLLCLSWTSTVIGGITDGRNTDWVTFVVMIVDLRYYKHIS